MAKPSRYELECSLDEALLENEDLRAKVEELEEMNYRLRSSERQVRESALTPGELVTLYMWHRIDGHDKFRVYTWRNQHDDFPEPVSSSHRAPLYDIADLRAWKLTWDEAQAARKAEAHRKFMIGLQYVREVYKTECS